MIEEPSNQKFLSIASLWEITIKVSIQKLQVGMSMSDLVTRNVYGNAIEILHIEAQHLDQLSSLPFYHKDPFDRIIVAQSLVEKMPLISADAIFDRYGITRLW